MCTNHRNNLGLGQGSQLGRRDLLAKSSALVAGTSLSSLFGSMSASAIESTEPHFFLQLNVFGGFDQSYLFDSRPLSMVGAGKKALYLNEEPTEWIGSNGHRTLVTPATAPLRAVQSDLTILNGVVMAAQFDGHEQNANFLTTGNPFGGAYFVPHLNHGPNQTLIDFVSTGFFMPFQSDNSQNGVPLNASSLATLKNRIQQETSANPVQVHEFVRSRMAKVGEGSGKLSLGARQMLAGHSRMSSLSDAVRRMNITPSEDPLEQSLQVVAQSFVSGLARSAFAIVDIRLGDQPANVDTHAASDAKESLAMATQLGENLARILKFLKETAFDQGRSLFDVTTVMFSSEFGRTMRQKGAPMDDSGTDHNPLTNTVLLAGKGIRGGRVLGASDYRIESEELSGAHQQLDPDGIKQMGLPFDHSTGAVRSDRPSSYNAGDYLSMPNIANSLMEIFGVDRKHFWVTERNAGIAPGIVTLI
jgi:hypothetical protein